MTPAEFKAIRIHLGYSVRGLAERFGWASERNVERIEAGEQPISQTLELAMIALAEGVAR